MVNMFWGIFFPLSEVSTDLQRLHAPAGKGVMDKHESNQEGQRKRAARYETLRHSDSKTLAASVYLQSICNY